MNMKKRAIAIVICLFLFVAFCIVYIFSELYSESEIPTPKKTDAIKFKQEYESINGEAIGENKIVRTIEIDEKNPFIYKTAEDIVKSIEEKETFIVYFGFATCPWCRSILEVLTETAKKNKIDKIYYVDVKDIRDTYELNKNHKAERTIEGTEGYYRLIEKLDPVLDQYGSLFYQTKKNKLKEVKINEKRIYAPNVIFVKSGVPIAKEDGISEYQTDAYMEINDEIKKDMASKFEVLFKAFNSQENICTEKGQKC